jgi:GT2 family glycosyltransferase
VSAPSVSIGLLVQRDPAALERLLTALAPQLQPGDELLVAPLVGILDPVGVAERLREAARLDRERDIQPVWEGPIGACSRSSAAARNRILTLARGEVVAFLDDGGLPSPGWLETVRSVFTDERVEAMAGGIVSGQPRRGGARPGARPGARLRWTGQVSDDLAALRPGTTSLASARNAAVLAGAARKAGGFDEAWGPGSPFEDVEFFVRLGKAGARLRFEPAARVTLTSGEAFPDTSDPGPEGSRIWNLEQQAARTRAMTAIFARHEVWALPLVLVSHLVLALIEVVAGRLPPHAPFRLLIEVVEGVRLAVHPVDSPWNPSGGPAKA